MIRVVQGFQLLTRDAVDWRLVLTRKQMREVNDNQMPDRYFAICKDDGYLYTYNKESEFDDDTEESTGRFEKYSSSKIMSVTINGKDVPIDINGNLDIPLMNNNTYGVAKPGKGLTTDNGIITLDFNAIDNRSIPVSKINFDGLILDAND